MKLDEIVAVEIDDSDSKYKQIWMIRTQHNDERIFCGTISIDEKTGLPESMNLPLGTETLTFDELVSQLVEQRLTNPGLCPECGSMDKHGIEYRGRYDGVSEWVCQVCKCRWDRFTGAIIDHGSEWNQ